MYPLNLTLVEFLTGAAARDALAELADADLSDAATLRLIETLRQTFPPAEAAALLDQARLRRKALDKFPQPDDLLFTEEGLQQASSRAVARYRAQEIAAALSGAAPDAMLRVADLGCGIGADTIAMAEAGLPVLALERDPVRARIAAHNVAALGLAGQVEVVSGDFATSGWIEILTPGEAIGAAFVDPGRRKAGRRVFDLEEMDPPLSAILPLAQRLGALAVKTMPGIGDHQIPAHAEVEFISDRGQMKEALLRFGVLRRGAARRATLLPGPHHLDSNAPLTDAPATEPLAFLLEPDAAVIRATLVQHLATALDARQIDPTIAYLTSDHWIDTPFARPWTVLRHGPFHLKTLNRWLREMEAGAVVVKKRGSPIDPDDFRRRLKTTPGGQPVTVFLTRSLDRPWMVVADQ